MTRVINSDLIFSRKELLETTDGLIGLTMALPNACDKLHLTNKQITIFIRNTPGNKKGEKLWIEFTNRRDKPGVKDYGFSNFMTEVLAEAGHPIS